VGHPRCGSIRHHHQVGVVELLARPADLPARDLVVLGLERVVLLFEPLRLQVERAHHAWRAAIGPGQRPIEPRPPGMAEARRDRLHRLAQDAVGQQDHGSAIALRELE